MPHRKFESEDGRQTEGFFSLAEGRYAIEDLKNAGVLTAEEAAATSVELAASGLPEFADLDDAMLVKYAGELTADLPLREREAKIANGVRIGAFSPAHAARLRELINT
jgi:hypothetical protein